MPSWVRGDYTIATDPALLDTSVIRSWLTTTYWAKGIPLDVVERAVQGSICFGVLCREELVGFGRVVTDGATFAWICDVFIKQEHRGQGLGRWLINSMREHPHLQGLRRWVLATWDAHGVYRACGFTPLRRPENWLEIRADDPYGAGASTIV